MAEDNQGQQQQQQSGDQGQQQSQQQGQQQGQQQSQQQAAPDWRAAITDAGLKEHAARFNTPADLVQGHLDLRKKLSTAIVPPGKDAKPEEITEYRKRIGVPEGPDGYKFEVPGGREATDADKAFQKAMATTFHGLNVTAEQAAGLNKAWNEHVAATMTAMAEADKAYAAEAEKALKTAWGAEYETNKTFANRAITKMFGDKLGDVKKIEGKDGRFVLDNPLLIEAFARIGREMGEDGLRGTMTDTDKTSVEGEIRELDKQFYDAYHKNNRTEAARIDKQRQALYAKLHGDAPIVGASGRTL